MDNFTPSISSDDFPYFLRFLEEIWSFTADEIIDVVEKPYHFSEHYECYKNYVRIQFSDRNIVKGYESNCCLDIVIKVGEDLICDFCYKTCENWCLNEND